MPRQAPFTKRTEIGVQKGQKMCKTMQNVHKQKKHFFGCPGKLHLQNAQKLECEEHKKCAKPRKMCANQKRNTFWMPRQAPLTKRIEIGVQKAKKICKTMQNVHKSKKLFWMPRQAPLTKHTEIGVQKAQKCAQKNHLFGCPGKLHLQNAQNLECKKHKNVQHHAQ